MGLGSVIVGLSFQRDPQGNSHQNLNFMESAEVVEHKKISFAKMGLE
jgi:hypothetical protein